MSDEFRYELDEVTEEELLQTVAQYFIAANNFKWQAIDMLCQARSDWGWDNDEWADHLRTVAVQIDRSEKTLRNWVTTGNKWPRRRREELGIEALSVSVLSEINGVMPEKRASSLATQAAEGCWTVEQVRAAISDQQGEKKIAYNPMEFFGGDGSRQWSIQLSMNPAEDARAIVENFDSEYVSDLITEIGFQMKEQVSR